MTTNTYEDTVTCASLCGARSADPEGDGWTADTEGLWCDLCWEDS